MSKDAAKVLIIGIGNTYRGDDGAGNAVAQRLAGQVPPEATVIEQSGEGTALVEAWKGAQFVIVVDAMESGAPAGTIRRFERSCEKSSRGTFSPLEPYVRSGRGCRTGAHAE